MNRGSKSWSGILAVVIATAVSAAVIALVSFTLRHFKHRHEYQGRPLEAWIMDINGADRASTEAARDALKEMGEDAVPPLIKHLESPGSDGKMRSRAALALGYIGRKAGAAAPALIKATDDGDPAVRLAAVNALDKIPVDQVKAVAVYVHLLEDSSIKVRYTAAQRLRHVPAEAKKTAVPALLKACTDSDAKVRDAARAALDALNVASPENDNPGAPPPVGN